jgi:hypothetical protein
MENLSLDAIEAKQKIDKISKVKKLKKEFTKLAPNKLEPFYLLLSYVVMTTLLFWAQPYLEIESEVFYIGMAIFAWSFVTMSSSHLFYISINKRIDLLAKIITIENKQSDV